MERLRQKIVEIVEQALAREGCELAELNLSRYRNSTAVRLFVYAEDGVTVDRCAQVSRVVGDLLDGTELFEDGYALEVSSPGLDRPLTSLRDFRYRVGEMVRISFCDRTRKKVTAEIVSTSDNTVRFRDDSGEFGIAMDEIEAATIVY